MTTVSKRLPHAVWRLLVVVLSAALMTIPAGGAALAGSAPGGGIGILAQDVYIRDFVGDTAVEPNDPTASYWNSPDVRFCPTTVLCAGTFTISALATTYIHVTLWNPGPYGSGTDNGSLRLYFTYMGGAAVWPSDWTPLGSILVTVPAGATTVVVPWVPTTAGLASTLYRWVSPNDPMLYEGSSAYQNARFNNNVAWKNVSVI